jgi:hypothetical protein
MADKVSLQKYLESRLASQEKAVEIARVEMNAWKASHNDLQHQMQSDRSEYVTRGELQAMYKKLEATERLVYIGVGLAMALSALIGFIKH